MYLTAEHPKHKAKLTELKEAKNNPTIRDGNLNIPFSIIDIATRQKINQEIEDLKCKSKPLQTHYNS